MKKFLKVISLIFFTFLLISCKIITVDGVNYRTGFYSKEILPRRDLTYIGDQYKVKGFDFLSHINHAQFDLLYGVDYGPAWGDGLRILYINESQWKIARDYYANSDNFLYYCDISRGNGKTYTTFTDIEPLKFDELMTFAEKSEFAEKTNYFGLNKKGKTRKVESLNLENTIRYTFYKESRDGIFTSYRYRFHLFEGKLLFEFADFNVIPIVVDVPDELGKYFVELLSQFSL